MGAIIAFVSGTGRGEKKGKDEKMMGLKNEIVMAKQKQLEMNRKRKSMKYEKKRKIGGGV